MAAWSALYALNAAFGSWLIRDVAGLESGSRLGDSLEFFLVDSIKIGLLLTGIIFVVGVLRTFVSVERTREVLGRRGSVVGYGLAAILGAVAPFCSCSAVPVFIGFVAAGVPLGMTMTFLIASPLVNEVAVVLVVGSFGWNVALLYVATGVTIAIGAGAAIGRLGLERWIDPMVFQTNPVALASTAHPSWSDRFAVARAEVIDILGKIWPYVLAGLAVGAAIHGWAPEDFFAEYAGTGNVLAVPLAVVLGVPLYSNAAGAIPLVEALHAKGVALGTSLAFMMSIVALSLPEMVLLRRVIKPPLLATFVAVVAGGILVVGYLLNAVL